MRAMLHAEIAEIIDETVIADYQERIDRMPVRTKRDAFGLSVAISQSITLLTLPLLPNGTYATYHFHSRLKRPHGLPKP